MTVEVRLFASLRDAAGTARTTARASDVATLLAELGARYGPTFAGRLARVTVVIDDEPATGPEQRLRDGAQVALLPPFSGGST